MTNTEKLVLAGVGFLGYRAYQKSEEEKKLLTPSSSANQGIGNGSALQRARQAREAELQRQQQFQRFRQGQSYVVPQVTRTSSAALQQKQAEAMAKEMAKEMKAREYLAWQQRTAQLQRQGWIPYVGKKKR